MLKKQLLFFLLVLTGISCSKLDEEINPDFFPPSGLDKIVLRDAKVLSYTGKSATLEFSMNMLYYYRADCLDDGFFGDYAFKYGTSLPASAFSFPNNQTMNYQIQAQQVVAPVLENNAFSTLLLIDNTSPPPVEGLDNPLENVIFEPINYFYLNNQKPNTIALASFNNMGGQKVKIHSSFNDSWQDFAYGALTMTEQSGGTNSLYEATYEMIDYVTKEATNAAKSITIITHSSPNLDKQKLQSLIVIAKQKNIKINVLDLQVHDFEADYFYLYQLAMKTGGMYVYAPTENEKSYRGFSNVMLNYASILKNQFYQYRLRIKINYTGTDPNYFEPGYSYNFSYLLSYFKTDRGLCYKSLPEEFETNYFYYAFDL